MSEQPEVTVNAVEESILDKTCLSKDSSSLVDVVGGVESEVTSTEGWESLFDPEDGFLQNCAE